MFPGPQVLRARVSATRADRSDGTAHPSILFFSVSGDYYGAPRSLFLLATGLKSKGVPVQVAVASEGLLAEKLRAAGIRVWIAPTNPYAGAPVTASYFARLIGKVIRRLRWGFWAGEVILR